MIRRLDVKILITLIVTAVIPMAVSIHLVATAVKTSLRLGINEDMGAALESSVEAHRAHIEALKKYHMAVAEGIGAASPVIQSCTGNTVELERVLRARCSAETPIFQIRILAGDSVLGKATCSSQKKTQRIVSRSASIQAGECSAVEVDFLVDSRLTADLGRAGEALKTFVAVSQASRSYLSNRVILVYVLLLGFVLGISIWQGVFWTRRMVRRIHTLCGATRTVAEGDLSVRVMPGADDEVGELIRSFNNMVDEISTNRARVEYLQKISAWQEIARRLAHEIKNPLTPIQLSAQELRTQYRGDDPAFSRLLSQSTEIIEEEVATLRRLVTDFSAFARMPEIRPERTDLAEFLRDCESSLAHLREQLNMAITWEIPVRPCPVAIDVMMMKRVFDNVVRNAGEALSANGTVDPRVHITVETGGRGKRREALIRVRDNGPGIRPEHHPSLFDPYFTTKEEGTGLGLAICKKIVLEHGGRIYVEDDSASGATFVIALPLLGAPQQ